MRLSEQELSLKISIHALCEEGDEALMSGELDDMEFLSTPSARRATRSWEGRRLLK